MSSHLVCHLSELLVSNQTLNTDGQPVSTCFHYPGIEPNIPETKTIDPSSILLILVGLHGGGGVQPFPANIDQRRGGAFWTGRLSIKIFTFTTKGNLKLPNLWDYWMKLEYEKITNCRQVANSTFKGHQVWAQNLEPVTTASSGRPSRNHKIQNSTPVEEDFSGVTGFVEVSAEWRIDPCLEKHHSDNQ